MHSTAKLAKQLGSHSGNREETGNKTPINAAEEEKTNKKRVKVAIDINEIAEHVRTSENPSMQKFYNSLPSRFSDAHQTHALLDAAGFLYTEAEVLHASAESKSAPTATAVSAPTPSRRSRSF